MTTEQINDIRYALNVADIDDNKAWDALNALLAELDAAKQLNADWEAASLVGGPRIDALRAELDAARAERDNAIDENIRLMSAETEALRAQLREARASEQNIAKELMAALNEPMYAGSRADWMFRAQKAEMDLDAARARNAKLREAAQGVCDETHADGSAEIGAWIAAMDKLRAALAEGEDARG